MDKIFKALADKNRRLIISLLKEKSMTVTEILTHFEVTQATLSSHLGILRKAKLVECQVEGRNRIYSLNQNLFKGFVKELNKFIGWEEFRDIEEIVVRK
jgi:DNA-binding transcriptional ArsR family regulator